MSLALLLALVGLVSAVSVKKEMVELSGFLDAKSSSSEPAENLQLIKANKDQLKGSFVVDSIIGLAEEASCEVRYDLASLKKHIGKMSNEKLVSLFSHVAQSYLNRCQQQYQTQLAKALSDIGEKQQSRLVELLSENFIQEYRQRDATITDDIYEENEPGDLIKFSVPLLVKFIKSHFEGNFNLKSKKHVLKGAKMVSKHLSKSCPALYEKSHKLVEEMRHLISIAGEEEKSKLASSLPEEFKTNLFRYRYCEDVVRASKSSKIYARIRKTLKTYNMNEMLNQRERRDFITIAVATVGILLILLLFGMIMSLSTSPVKL